jgi:DNA polymerase-4
MDFNPQPPSIMHIDLNSCFATIEQQANPFLRGKPIVVAAFDSPKGCILAASVEAKRQGIKTGMRVIEGRKINSKLIVLTPDPWKYRCVHLAIKKVVSDYTDDFLPKSIDEFVLNLKERPCLRGRSIYDVGREIKQRIKTEVGEYLTVSMGISTNKYLAKVASNIKKPDGLEEINKNNFLSVYSKLKLTDLMGIKKANAKRLNSMGIYSVSDFYNAPLWRLKASFHSITSLYWYERLRGYEVDSFIPKRGSYGNSVAIGKSVVSFDEISPILCNLVEKMARRLRVAGYKACGVYLALFYKNGSFWHKGKSFESPISSSKDFFKRATTLLKETSCKLAVRNIAVSAFNLIKTNSLQLEIFEDVEKKDNLTNAVDEINEKWGDFVIRPAVILKSKQNILDRIAFGGVKELEELTFS